MPVITAGGKRTQGERRSQSRAALLEAAAQGLSRDGYANLSLEAVAADAGYSRGALYHQFAGKADLALAVVRWIDQTWTVEVGQVMDDEPDPVAALIAMARAHAVYCRRDVARVMLNLRVEFAGRDHPVGSLITELLDDLEARCMRLIEAGRAKGAIPPGPEPSDVASAYLSTVEAVGIALGGRSPADVELVERAVRGLLGLQPADVTTPAAPAGEPDQ